MRGSAKEPGAIRSLVMGSLGRKTALAVLSATLVLGAVVAFPVYERFRTDFVADTRGDTRRLVRTVIDPYAYPTLDELIAKGEHLVRTADVTGGVYLSGIGEVLGAFGEPPRLQWTDARIEGASWRMAPDHSRFEMFFAPEATGTSYGLILARDPRATWQAALARGRDALLLALIVAVGLAAASACFIHCHILRPLAAIRRSVDFALNQPERAYKHLSQIPRRDEIGQLSRAVDQLLFFTANTVDDELASALAITERNPHAIMTFSSEGHLLSANAAALRLFSARDVEALAQRGPGSLFRFDGEPTTAGELLARDTVLGHGEVVLPGGSVPCLIGGDTVRRPDGTPLRLFLTFVDVTTLVEDMREQVRLAEAATGEMKTLRARVERMRLMFDACLVLLELDNEAAAPDQAVTLSPDDLIDRWLSRSVDAGSMNPGAIATEGLPPVIGDPDELRRLFDTVLNAVRMRSATSRPSFRILSAMKNADQVTITVHSEPEAGSDMPYGSIAAGEDVSLMVAAAAVLARRQGGRLVATELDDGGNAVIFALPVDRQTMDLGDARATAA